MRTPAVLGIAAFLAHVGAAAFAEPIARVLTLDEALTAARAHQPLTDAQVVLTTAAQQEVQARYNLAVARTQLLRALGQP